MFIDKKSEMNETFIKIKFPHQSVMSYLIILDDELDYVWDFLWYSNNNE